MRIGQSIWSREDFNLKNPSSSILFSSPLSSGSLSRFSTEQIEDETQNLEPEIVLPHGNLINSSKKLFVNKLVRNRVYEPQKCTTYDGTPKTIFYFRTTRILIDETGPFWPMAFPIKHPTPSIFLSLKYTRENRFYSKEYYYSSNRAFLGVQSQQTFDNQPAMRKYTDVVKHPILIYDMDKSPRQQQAKPFDSEQMCPSLMFESRFEGGNLRQVKRV